MKIDYYFSSTNEFNAEEFKSLMKQGIGNRTQVEFAKETGVAKETICRMLSSDYTVKPRPKTLYLFAEHMATVDLNSLLKSCGYAEISANDVVEAALSDIDDFFSFQPDSVKSYNDIHDFIKDFTDFLSIAKHKIDSHINVVNDVDPNNYEFKYLAVHWKFDKNLYTMLIRVHCQTLVNSFKSFRYDVNVSEQVYNKHIPEDAVKINSYAYVRPVKYVPIGELYEKSRHITNLFQSLYSHSNDEDLMKKYNFDFVVGLREGLGFNLHGMPEGFIDFLHAKAHWFCDCKENILLYNRLVCGEDPEQLFADYNGISDYKGIGAVISYIMTNEYDVLFEYYGKDKKVPDLIQSECIMYVDSDFDDAEAKKALTKYIMQCAKILRLPTFGKVYHNYSKLIDNSVIYNTSKVFMS